MEAKNNQQLLSISNECVYISTRVHTGGQVARVEGERTGNKCDACYKISVCQTCHCSIQTTQGLK